MHNDKSYKLVRDKLTSSYSYDYEALRAILSNSINGIDVIEVERLLTRLSSLKMKIEILESVATDIINPNQQFLFD